MNRRVGAVVVVLTFAACTSRAVQVERPSRTTTTSSVSNPSVKGDYGCGPMDSAWIAGTVVTTSNGPVEVILLVDNVQTASSGPLDAVAGETVSFGFDPSLDDETYKVGVGVLRGISLHERQPFADATVTLRMKPGVGCG